MSTLALCRKRHHNRPYSRCEWSEESRQVTPNVARDWVLAVLCGIETSIRDKEVQEAERSIAFLKAESAENSLISLNEVLLL